MEADEEDVSYDVESLFTSIPVKETIDYICTQIYEEKKLKPICKRSIFEKLLYKLTTECTFSANNKLYKQTDGVTMGGPLSVVFSGCFMNKLENSVVKPENPKLYKRFVDDVYHRRKRGIKDMLLEKLNNFHPNIHFTVETNPTKFLDTKILRENNKPSEFRVYDNENKIPFHWTSAVPKKYKRNVISGELHRATRISSYFAEEEKRIKSKFQKAGYPKRFIESIIGRNKSNDNELIIPNWLFLEPKKEIFIRIPFCPKNEICINKILKQLEQFCNEKFCFKVIWNTRKIKSLFPVKDKVKHHSNVIYEGKCSCDERYVGETKRNAEIRWREHQSNDGKSEPAKHLQKHPGHSFEWKILSKAPRDTKKRKVLEAYFIRLIRPSINDQLDIRFLNVYRNGIT